jgi:hypothetical protein
MRLLPFIVMIAIHNPHDEEIDEVVSVILTHLLVLRED